MEMKTLRVGDVVYFKWSYVIRRGRVRKLVVDKDGNITKVGVSFWPWFIWPFGLAWLEIRELLEVRFAKEGTYQRGEK